MGFQLFLRRSILFNVSGFRDLEVGTVFTLILNYFSSDVSVENLRYLTTEQALADIAYFVSGMNTMYSLTDTKWIAYGGSYSGNLAAWVRYKYPHLIHGANSASGPVLAKVDFFGKSNKSSQVK